MLGVVIDSVDEVECLFWEVFVVGYEGVFVKLIDVFYVVGCCGKFWVKVKFVLIFDLVVFGVEWGLG